MRKEGKHDKKGQGDGTGQGASGGATLTSWSSFTRSCSCIRTVYSSSHLTDIGKRKRT
jgi:hypothetical protein